MMSLDKFAEFYVNYLEPGMKFFLLFLLIMGVFAFWAQVKDGKLLELSNAVFHGTIQYTYKALFFIGLGIWIVLRGIGRTFHIIFATVRDFFISRI
jgi:protein-S-isoprenylcysteine O-methyltransferase Ste14